MGTDKNRVLTVIDNKNRRRIGIVLSVIILILIIISFSIHIFTISSLCMVRTHTSETSVSIDGNTFNENSTVYMNSTIIIENDHHNSIDLSECSVSFALIVNESQVSQYSISLGTIPKGTENHFNTSIGIDMRLFSPSVISLLNNTEVFTIKSYIYFKYFVFEIEYQTMTDIDKEW